MTAGGRVLLVGPSSGSLIPMEERPNSLEIELQGLAARYPDPLAGDRMRPEDPRRWLRVTREMSVREGLGP